MRLKRRRLAATSAFPPSAWGSALASNASCCLTFLSEHRAMPRRAQRLLAALGLALFALSGARAGPDSPKGPLLELNTVSLLQG